MTDMLQQARERHEQIKKAISQHEAEIELLKGEAEKLEHFAALAKELFAQKAEKTPEQPALSEPPQAQPRPEASAQPTQEAPRVMPMRQPQSA